MSDIQVIILAMVIMSALGYGKLSSFARRRRKAALEDRGRRRKRLG